MKTTSQEAYERVKPSISTHNRMILSVLRDKELTGYDIAKLCGLSYHQVMRRMSELERLNLVETTTKDNIQKRMKYKIID